MNSSVPCLQILEIEIQKALISIWCLFTHHTLALCKVFGPGEKKIRLLYVPFKRECCTFQCQIDLFILTIAQNIADLGDLSSPTFPTVNNIFFLLEANWIGDENFIFFSMLQ